MPSIENSENESLMSHPPIASREEWQRARDQLLVKEKAATRARDALAAERRRLPMFRIEKNYVFEGPRAKRACSISLPDVASSLSIISCLRQMLKAGLRLVVPAAPWWWTTSVPLTHLHARNTSLVLVSRAPLANLESYKTQNGMECSMVFLGRHGFQ